MSDAARCPTCDSALADPKSGWCVAAAECSDPWHEPPAGDPMTTRPPANHGPTAPATDRSTPVSPMCTPHAKRSDAELSDDGLYRYRLTRSWGRPTDPQVCWVMLNPSTADAIEDDPTIRRCIGFSEAWGFGSLIVVNLYAFRATKPADLIDAARAGVDPIGTENDHAIRLAAVQSNKCIAAWGTKGRLGHRNAEVIRIVTGDCMENMYALDITKDGHPKHPLYVKGDTVPRLYRQAVA